MEWRRRESEGEREGGELQCVFHQSENCNSQIYTLIQIQQHYLCVCNVVLYIWYRSGIFHSHRIKMFAKCLQLGFLSAIPYIAYFVVIIVGGMVADKVLDAHLLSTIAVRRLAMLIGELFPISSHEY